MMYNRDLAVVILGFILAIFLIIVGPLITIWSLNTLFPVLAIPYNIWTWLATVFIFTAIRANVSVKRKD
jgi:tryptophan-rich sensory protein